MGRRRQAGGHRSGVQTCTHPVVLCRCGCRWLLLMVPIQCVDGLAHCGGARRWWRTMVGRTGFVMVGRRWRRRTRHGDGSTIRGTVMVADGAICNDVHTGGGLDWLWRGRAYAGAHCMARAGCGVADKRRRRTRLGVASTRSAARVADGVLLTISIQVWTGHA